MADRKQFLGNMTANPTLLELLRLAKQRPVTEDELREQRISFAFGNAPARAERITKESVRYASKHLKLR